ncbi:hypothetical protein ACVFI8_19540 [Agarivorans sp. MS3-6]
MNNFSRTILAASVFLLSPQVNATVQVQHLDYSLLLTDDCSSSASTISIASSQIFAHMEQLQPITKALIDESILVAHLPSVNSTQPYFDFALLNKSTSKSTIKPSDMAFSYHWEKKYFEWFNAYQSNQSQLTPAPFLALARIKQQTWASAAASITNQQQLPAFLEEDYIKQRSPLIVFINSAAPLNGSDLLILQEHDLQVHQTGQLIIATRGVAVCDSGVQQGNNQQHLAWIKTDLQK